MRLSPVVRSFLVVLASFAVFGAILLVDGSIPRGGAGTGTGQEPGLEEPGDGAEDNPELEEQAEQARERKEALEEAQREGRAGQQRPLAAAAAPAGWAGEQPVSTTADDWEPAVATDPNAPWVYTLVTRYGVGAPCPGNCPDPFIGLRVSADGGATWTDKGALCACKGSGQFDPIIEVVQASTGPNAGAVYAVYMNGFNIMFIKSTNHGTSWSAPVKVYGNVSWNDKPVLAMSDNGNDVFIAFNGPTGGDPWLAQSHNAGSTWTQTKLTDSARYIFAFDADVASDGTVYLAQTSLLYGGGGNKGSFPSGAIEEHVYISTNNGASWTDKLVASTQPGMECVADGCSPDFYLAHSALTVDNSGRVVLLYDGATTAHGPQQIYSTVSTNQGSTWSAPVAISQSGEEAVNPAVEARGTGDFRAMYAQTSGGANPDRWNTYYKTSTDGLTWSAAVVISDATSGAAYKTANGYLEVYGDYGEIAITSTGKTIAIWGEGLSYTGPGGVWFNRQT